MRKNGVNSDAFFNRNAWKSSTYYADLKGQVKDELLTLKTKCSPILSYSRIAMNLYSPILADNITQALKTGTRL